MLNLRLLCPCLMFLLSQMGCLFENNKPEKPPIVDFTSKVELHSADAGHDTSISISDYFRAQAHGVFPIGGGWLVEWDIGNRGHFHKVSSTDTLIMGLDSIGLLDNVLRISDLDDNVSLDTFRVSVYNDIPAPKLRVERRRPSEGLGQILMGSANDLGNSLSYAWKFGDSGAFVLSSGSDTLFNPNLRDGMDLKCSLQVTDDDGNQAKTGSILTVSNWQTFADILPPTTAYSPFSAAAYNNKIYVSGGGKDDNIYHPKINVWDPVTEKWTELNAEIPRPAEFKLVSAKGKLYAIGGEVLHEIWLFDTRTEEWIKLKDAPFNQSSVSAFAEANGKIYLAGGIASTYQYVSVDKVQEYNPEMDSWSIKAEIPIDVFEHALVGIDENLFVVGGRAFVPGGRNKVLWKLGLKADTWTTLDTLSFVAIRPAAVALAGKIYCIGGIDSSLKVQVYDRLMNKWEIGSPIKYPVEGQMAVVIKGKIYAVSQDWKIEVFTP